MCNPTIAAVSALHTLGQAISGGHSLHCRYGNRVQLLLTTGNTSSRGWGGGHERKRREVRGAPKEGRRWLSGDGVMKKRGEGGRRGDKTRGKRGGNDTKEERRAKEASDELWRVNTLSFA